MEHEDHVCWGKGSTDREVQSGQVKLASKETILYSEHPDHSAPHTQEVAFMLSKEARRAVISWEPINSRIITAKFQIKWDNATPPPMTLLMKPKTNSTTNYITFSRPGKQRTS